MTDSNEILEEVAYTAILATGLGHASEAVEDVLDGLDFDDPRYDIIDRIGDWLSNQEDNELHRLYLLVDGKKEQTSPEN